MRSLFLTILFVIITLWNPITEAATGISFPGPQGITLSGVLYQPTGKGPFPAIVGLHGCGGFDGKSGSPNGRDADWGDRLAKLGYIVLLPDSFDPRGVKTQCDIKNRVVRPDIERRADAFAAKNYLQTRADVKPNEIALMGWSNGGSTVLYTIAGSNSNSGLPDFTRAVAFYPNCRDLAAIRNYHPRTPLLLLIGDSDKAMPLAPCKAIIQEAKSTGQKTEIIVYSGAGHSFDQPDAPSTNKAARADVLKRVPIFLNDF